MEKYILTRRPNHHRADKRGRVREHILVAERTFGISVGRDMHVHHIDGNVRNNDPSNLQILTPMEHKRIHSGWNRIEGQWHKACTRCRRVFAANYENFYPRQSSRNAGEFLSWCRHCCIKDVLARREKRAKLAKA